MNDTYLDIRDLAKKTKTQPSWWYARVERGEVPHIRLGKYIRFKPDEIHAWLEGQSVSVKE